MEISAQTTATGKRVRTVQPNNALHAPLDPARLALPLQATCLKCVFA